MSSFKTLFLTFVISGLFLHFADVTTADARSVYAKNLQVTGQKWKTEADRRHGKEFCETTMRGKYDFYKVCTKVGR